jgi:putative membrane protein (TIGR04086 family)
MEGTRAAGTSASTKATVTLASVGLQALCYAVFAMLLPMFPLPFWFLYVEVSEVSLLSPRAVLSYLAIVVAAAFAGWSLRRKEWLYGLIVGASTRLGSIGLSVVSLTQMWVALRRDPQIIYQAPGNLAFGIPERWLVIVLMPVVAGGALGAAGGLLGRWLRGQRGLRSGVDLHASPDEES